MSMCIAKKLKHFFSECVEIPHAIVLGVILTAPKAFKHSVGSAASILW